MKVNFKEPLLISKGLEQDQVFISIKDPSLFISNVTGKAIPTENIQLLNDVPKQLPNDVNATEMMDNAK